MFFQGAPAGTTRVTYGSYWDDTISGGHGNDIIYAGAGDDYVYDGGGSDILYGQSGNDRFFAIGDGIEDIFYGGIGNDQFYASDDKVGDVFVGGAGDDYFYGKLNGSVFHGDDYGWYARLADSDDMVTYENYHQAVIIDFNRGYAINRFVTDDARDDFRNLEKARGTNFDDLITGHKYGASELYGHGGNDEINGGKRDDYLSGGTGDDTIYGDDGDDALVGGAGADFLSAGLGADFVNSGAGNDLIFLGIDDGRDVFRFAEGHDKDSILGFDPHEDVIQIMGFAGINDFSDILDHATEGTYHSDLLTAVTLDFGSDEIELKRLVLDDLHAGMFEFI